MMRCGNGRGQKFMASLRRTAANATAAALPTVARRPSILAWAVKGPR